MIPLSLENTVLKSVLCALAENAGEYYVPAAVSGRHVHLTDEAVEKLFGAGYQLQPLRYLSQPGQFACKETLILSGLKGTIKNVRILGPVREKIQVELSVTDCIALGVQPIVRRSGDTGNFSSACNAGNSGNFSSAGNAGNIGNPDDISNAGNAGDTGVTESLELTGTHGSIKIDSGVMVAARHLHISPEQARAFKLSDGETVSLEKEGIRPAYFGGFVTRVSDSFDMEAHIDTDEANAALIENGDLLRLHKESRI